MVSLNTFGPETPLEENKNLFFGPETNVIKTQATPTDKDRQSHFMSNLLGVEFKDVSPIIDSGATIKLDEDAQAITEVNKKEIALSSFEISEEGKRDIAQTVEQLRDINEISRFIPPSSVAMLTSGDPYQVRHVASRLRKLVSAQSIIQDKVGEASPDGFWSWLNAGGDFLDYVGSSPMNLFNAKKNQEYADEVLDMIYSNISEEDFENRFEDLLTQMSDYGLFTDANRFYLKNFLDIIAAGSESQVARIQTALGTIDTALGIVDVTLVGKVVKGSKLISAGKTVKSTSGIVAKNTLGSIDNITKDAARAVGFVKKDPVAVKKILDDTVTLDDPGSSSTILGNHVAESATTPSYLRAEYWSSPSKQAMRIFEDTSIGLKTVLANFKTTGKSLNQEGLQAKVDEIVAQRKEAHIESGNERFLDTDFEVDDFENLYVKDILGTKKGDVFKGVNGQKAAQKYADDIGGEVRAYDAPNTFVVVRTENVPTQVRNLSLNDLQLWRQTDAQDLGVGNIVEYAMSPLAQTNPFLNGILKQAEAGREKWTRDFGAEFKAVTKLLNKNEEKELFKVFDELRDGTLATQREGLTSAEFMNEFFDIHKSFPTDAQVAAYLKYQEYLDIDALFSADILFKKAVSDNVLVITTNKTSGTQVRTVTPNEVRDTSVNAKIWDDQLGVGISLDEVPEGQKIFRLYDGDETFAGNLQFFTTSEPRTRRLFLSDVMQRNAGGPRIYRKQETQLFLKQNREKVFADGTKAKLSPLTLMAFRTEKEARLAKTQVNNIIEGLNSKLDPANFTNAEDYREVIKGLVSDPLINSLVLKNNSFLKDSVYDVKTLVEFAEEFGLDLRKNVEFVGDGKSIVDADALSPFSGMGLGDSLRLRGSRTLARKDKPLLGFGGRELKTYPAKEAITKKLAEGIAVNSDRAYQSAAINGLLRSSLVNNVVENIDEIKGPMTLRQRLDKIKIDESTKVGKALGLERRKIQSRLDRKSAHSKIWDRVTIGLSNYMYDKNMLKTSDFIAGRSTDPYTALRGYVFDQKLGMFNPDQLMVQSSQIIKVNYLAEGNAGIIGTALYAPMRFAVLNGNENVIRHLGKTLEKTTGLTADQFVGMVSSFKASGRGITNLSIAELGEDASLAASGFRGIREAGRIFFKEGELVARISGYNTAYIEYLRKFPTVNPASNEAQRWIMNRQDVLTQAMTGISRTPVDQLPFLQFASYMFRLNEAIFSGTFAVPGGRKLLSNKEKAKLVIGDAVLFGANGFMGFSFAMDRIRHLYGHDIDTPGEEELYKIIQKGLLDGIIRNATGVDTSLGSRLGTGDGMFMLTRDLIDKNALEFFGGPSLELGTDSLGILFNTLKHISTGVPQGNYILLQEDLESIAKLATSSNKAINAYKAFKYQEYYSKSGALIADDLSTGESIALAMGVPTGRMETAWKVMTQTQLDKLLLKSTAKDIERSWNNYAEAMRRDDMESMRKWGHAIALSYGTLNGRQKTVVERMVYKKGSPIVDELFLKALKQNSGLYSVLDRNK